MVTAAEIREQIINVVEHSRQERVAEWLDSFAAAVTAEVREKQPLTFKRLQEEQRPWVAHNFPGRHPHYPLLGAVEELGELCHAHLKLEQGIRGTPDEHKAAKEDAVADAIIFLADYCSANNIDLQEAVEKTWAEVSKRDWKADPKNGRGAVAGTCGLDGKGEG